MRRQSTSSRLMSGWGRETSAGRRREPPPLLVEAAVVLNRLQPRWPSVGNREDMSVREVGDDGDVGVVIDRRPLHTLSSGPGRVHPADSTLSAAGPGPPLRMARSKLESHAHDCDRREAIRCDGLTVPDTTLHHITYQRVIGYPKCDWTKRSEFKSFTVRAVIRPSVLLISID